MVCDSIYDQGHPCHQRASHWKFIKPSLPRISFLNVCTPSPFTQLDLVINMTNLTFIPYSYKPTPPRNLKPSLVPKPSRTFEMSEEDVETEPSVQTVIQSQQEAITGVDEAADHILDDIGNIGYDCLIPINHDCNQLGSEESHARRFSVSLQESENFNVDEPHEVQSVKNKPNNNVYGKRLYHCTMCDKTNYATAYTQNSSSTTSSFSSSSLSTICKELQSVYDINHGCTASSLTHYDSPAEQDNEGFVDVDVVGIEANDTIMRMDDDNSSGKRDYDSLYEIESDEWDRTAAAQVDQPSQSKNGPPKSTSEQSNTEEDGGRELNPSVQQETSTRAEMLPKSPDNIDFRSATESADCEWEIYKITGKRTDNGTTHYLVRWQETWEPEHALGNARELIDGFEGRRRARLAGQIRGGKRQAGEHGMGATGGSKRKKRRLQA